MKFTLTILFVSALVSYHTFAQSVSITFEVNMVYQIDLEDFDPETETVDIAGSFNGWGATEHQLMDEDGDSTYSITISGFSSGTSIAFKFRQNFAWDGSEEFPGGGPNRTYTVPDSNSVVSVWYNDEAAPTGPPVADFSALSTQTFLGSSVLFSNQSSGRITNFEWTFEGGTPESSSEAEPSVRYSEIGSYDVQLIASNENQSDTLLIEDYITVTERELGEPKWWNEVVWYEIFVRSFYDSDGDGIGDFNGLTQKLDYLNDGDPNTDTDLGIGGIWLMPIHPSPSYHGYDVTDYRGIHPDYGTMEDFKNFLAAAHDRGIKVIIDYVMNHTSTEHPWFQASAAGDTLFRDFYRWEESKPNYTGPWGQTVWHQRNGDYYYGLFWGGMPDLNYENPAVKDSMFDISDFWIEEVGIDGFRQDAVLYIDEDGDKLKNTPETFQFWQDFTANLKAANSDAFSVGEAWEPTETVLQYINNDRLDYAFEFDLAGAILSGVNNGDASGIIRQMQKVYDNYPFLQYGNFLTNHDMNRVMNVLGSDIDKAKVAASLYLTLPGIPYLYYGEEVGMLGQKPDEDIRLPMQWSDEANAGFTSGNPWRQPNANFRDFNVEVMREDENSLFNHYRRLIQLRSSRSNRGFLKYPSLSTGQFEAGSSSNSEILSFVRMNEPGGVGTLVIQNVSGEDITEADIRFSNTLLSNNYCTTSPSSNNLLNDEYKSFEWEPYGGTDEIQILSLDISAFETQIFSLDTYCTSNESLEDPQSFQLHQNYPNPFNPSTNISFYLPQSAEVQLTVYDVTGRLVTTLENGLRNAGSHVVPFDASALSSGMYFYKIEAGDFSETRKMMLIK
ncbi:MAG: T9SS type A sorting domain-containing protein [Balneolaceae bacterium]|nr:T9SS type A sorting domain-containing protein [Balneolaceae bacterium]